MAERLLIQGGRVIDPASGFDDRATVIVERGVIAEIVPLMADALTTDAQMDDRDTQIINARGMIVSPGFVDLHCHLRQPGLDHKETIASGTLAAARGGFTTICCMPNTLPPLDSPATLATLRAMLRGEAIVRVAIIAAITEGQRGERLTDMAALAAAGAVAFSDDGRPVSTSSMMAQALAAAAQLDRPLTVHEEDPVLARGGVMNAGPVAEALGLPGLPAAAEDAMIARDIELLAHAPGARLHIAHVSTSGAVDLLRDAHRHGLAVTGEVTPHHLTLTDALVARPWNGFPYDSRTKVNPPLRSASDVAATIAGLCDNTLAAIATDHAPHSTADKDGSYADAAFGISLFETALGSVLSLVQANHLSLPALVSRMTLQPARIFGLPAGTLGIGSAADITIFDPQRPWIVHSDTFASRGKNTPLDGAMLHGQVRWTICGGTVVYEASANDNDQETPERTAR